MATVCATTPVCDAHAPQYRQRCIKEGEWTSSADIPLLPPNRLPIILSEAPPPPMAVFLCGGEAIEQPAGRRPSPLPATENGETAGAGRHGICERQPGSVEGRGRNMRVGPVRVRGTCLPILGSVEGRRTTCSHKVCEIIHRQAVGPHRTQMRLQTLQPPGRWAVSWTAWLTLE